MTLGSKLVPKNEVEFKLTSKGNVAVFGGCNPEYTGQVVGERSRPTLWESLILSELSPQFFRPTVPVSDTSTFHSLRNQLFLVKMFPSKVSRSFAQSNGRLSLTEPTPQISLSMTEGPAAGWPCSPRITQTHGTARVLRIRTEGRVGQNPSKRFPLTHLKPLGSGKVTF